MSYKGWSKREIYNPGAVWPVQSSPDAQGGTPNELRPPVEQFVLHDQRVSISKPTLLVDPNSPVSWGCEGWLRFFGFYHLTLIKIMMIEYIYFLAFISWTIATPGYAEVYDIFYYLGPTHTLIVAVMKLVSALIAVISVLVLAVGIETHKLGYVIAFLVLWLINVLLFLATIGVTHNLENFQTTQSYLKQYFNGEATDSAKEDFVQAQKQFFCCGSSGPDDYKQDPLPDTCCRTRNTSCTLGSNSTLLNRLGCAEPMHDYVMAMFTAGHPVVEFGIISTTWVAVFLIIFTWEIRQTNKLEAKQKLAHEAKLLRSNEEPMITEDEIKNPDKLFAKYTNFIEERYEEMSPGGVYPAGWYGRDRSRRLIEIITLFVADAEKLLSTERAGYVEVLLRLLGSSESIDSFMDHMEMIAAYYETIQERELDLWYLAGLADQFPVEAVPTEGDLVV